ncbi:hypothetical protein RF11_13514 [Thelohanellus kitauei]|uniref:Uncharacterized protein n=1 Tax=Thelohanellus kitauei TaxID=669202 RepID=A0A0C2M1E8_THEKT|nr:hypothetical protein RF11_13514 [Thelohanellus kitauei]
MSGKKAPAVVSIVSLLLMLMTLPPSETRGSFKCPSHLSTFFEETDEPKSGSLSKKEKKWAKIFKCASKMVSTFGRLPKLKEIEDCCKKHAKGLFKRCDKKVYQFSTCMMNKPDYFITVIAHSGSFPVSRPPGPGFPPPGPYYGHYTTTSHLSQLYSSSGPPTPSKPPSGSSPHFFSPPPPPPFSFTSLYTPPSPKPPLDSTSASSPPPSTQVLGHQVSIIHPPPIIIHVPRRLSITHDPHTPLLIWNHLSIFRNPYILLLLLT